MLLIVSNLNLQQYLKKVGKLKEMPKKINGFVVFMKEIYEKEKKSGNNLRWADAANFVAPMWEVLSFF